jgi:hypothetical protein
VQSRNGRWGPFSRCEDDPALTVRPALGTSERPHGCGSAFDPENQSIIVLPDSESSKRAFCHLSSDPRYQRQIERTTHPLILRVLRSATGDTDRLPSPAAQSNCESRLDTRQPDFQVASPACVSKPCAGVSRSARIAAEDEPGLPVSFHSGRAKLSAP